MVKIYNLGLIAESEDTKSCFEFYLLVYHESEKGFDPNSKRFCFLLSLFWSYEIHVHYKKDSMSTATWSKKMWHSLAEAEDLLWIGQGQTLGEGHLWPHHRQKTAQVAGNINIILLRGLPWGIFFTASIFHPWSWPTITPISFVIRGWSESYLNKQEIRVSFNRQIVKHVTTNLKNDRSQPRCLFERPNHNPIPTAILKGTDIVKLGHSTISVLIIVELQKGITTKGLENFSRETNVA